MSPRLNKGTGLITCMCHKCLPTTILPLLYVFSVCFLPSALLSFCLPAQVSPLFKVSCLVIFSIVDSLSFLSNWPLRYRIAKVCGHSKCQVTLDVIEPFLLSSYHMFTACLTWVKSNMRASSRKVDGKKRIRGYHLHSLNESTLYEAVVLLWWFSSSAFRSNMRWGLLVPIAGFLLASFFFVLFIDQWTFFQQCSICFLWVGMLSCAIKYIPVVNQLLFAFSLFSTQGAWIFGPHTTSCFSWVPLTSALFGKLLAGSEWTVTLSYRPSWVL